MDLLASKVLPLFVYPLSAFIVLVFLTVGLITARRIRLAQAALSIAVAGLWIASSPAFANWLCMRLEIQYPPKNTIDLPSADAIVLLGGVLGQPLAPRVTADLKESADRIVEAFRLYRAHKASHIVISGGNLPWESSIAPEAELIAELLVEMGVPGTALVLESKSRNTFENAQNTAAVFSERGWHKGLLVTSGIHMPRALATFRHAGMEVIPTAADIRSHYPLADSVLDFLPDADAMADTTAAIKEIIGLQIYRHRNWAD